MNNRFKALARFGMHEHMLSHVLTIQRTVSGDEMRAKGLCNSRHCTAAREGASAGDGIGIDDASSAFFQTQGHSALPAADTAGQSQPLRGAWRLLGHKPMAASIDDGPKIKAVSPASARKGPNGT